MNKQWTNDEWRQKQLLRQQATTIKNDNATINRRWWIWGWSTVPGGSCWQLWWQGSTATEIDGDDNGDGTRNVMAITTETETGKATATPSSSVANYSKSNTKWQLQHHGDSKQDTKQQTSAWWCFEKNSIMVLWQWCSHNCCAGSGKGNCYSCSGIAAALASQLGMPQLLPGRSSVGDGNSHMQEDYIILEKQSTVSDISSTVVCPTRQGWQQYPSCTSGGRASISWQQENL